MRAATKVQAEDAAAPRASLAEIVEPRQRLGHQNAEVQLIRKSDSPTSQSPRRQPASEPAGRTRDQPSRLADSLVAAPRARIFAMNTRPGGRKRHATARLAERRRSRPPPRRPTEAKSRDARSRRVSTTSGCSRTSRVPSMVSMICRTSGAKSARRWRGRRSPPGDPDLRARIVHASLPHDTPHNSTMTREQSFSTMSNGAS